MKNVWNKNPKSHDVTPRKLAFENNHMEVYEMFKTEIGSFSSMYSSICNVYLNLPKCLRDYLVITIIIIVIFSAAVTVGIT